MRRLIDSQDVFGSGASPQLFRNLSFLAARFIDSGRPGGPAPSTQKRTDRKHAYELSFARISLEWVQCGRRLLCPLVTADEGHCAMTALRAFAIILTALILIPSGAHLFELPGKIDLERDAYFKVQSIYAGWSLFGAPIIAAVFANAGLYVAERARNPASARLALAAAVLIVVSLGVFFAWIYPANQATANWTSRPENWEALRRQWEYGHAANALLVGLALIAVTLAVVRR